MRKVEVRVLDEALPRLRLHQPPIEKVTVSSMREIRREINES